MIRPGYTGQITVKSGQGFGMDAFDITDPVGDRFSFLRYNYQEAGSREKPVPVEAAGKTTIKMKYKI